MIDLNNVVVGAMRMSQKESLSVAVSSVTLQEFEIECSDKGLDRIVL